MGYVICCKKGHHKERVVETEKEAKQLSKRFTLQKLPCEACGNMGNNDWVFMAEEEFEAL